MENPTPALETAAEPAPKYLTIEAIYQEKIFEAAFLREPHWMQDGQRFSYLDRAHENGATTVFVYDVRTGERKPIVDPAKLKLKKADRPKQEVKSTQAGDEEDDGDAPDNKSSTLAITAYQWSPDETKLLFARLPHRRSSQGDYALFVYDLAAATLTRVTTKEGEYRNAKWSPDSRKLGYVRADDIYVLDLATGQETRLTDTAAPQIYNGRFGWVYEEELDIVDGWAWSPDSRHIAYFQQDERPVPQINITNYDDLHLKPVETRYPKSGDPNPIVKIGVVPVSGQPGASVPPTRWMDIGADTDIYIARLQWTPQGDLLLQRLPRLQNRIELLKGDPATGKTTVILTDEDKAWVDAPGDLTFVKGTDQFFWISDRSGYRHLYLYDLSGKLLQTLTKGDWDVDTLAGVDAAHRLAYFTAANPGPLERQLFSVLLDGGGSITQLSDSPGQHRPLFSPDGGHYLDTFSSRATPPHTRLYRASGQHLAVVHENPMPKLDGHQLGSWEFTTFKTSDGVTLNAAILKPSDFDPKKKYPVLMYTYGGPGSQVVQDSFGNGGGLEQLMSQKGYIAAMVDGRGSGFRGRDFMKVTYQNLGYWEVVDQMEGAKWLGTLPYVDASRIGIWGWSYGGYMAALCITRGADVFKAAVAVAPVTHWNFYDSIYTERYMRRPQDNPKGYAESAPLTHADKLRGKFLLVHGTADDNVHFQNSARLVSEFEKHGKQFRTMYYPGKHHGLEGAANHLFTMLTDFISENL